MNTKLDDLLAKWRAGVYYDPDAPLTPLPDEVNAQVEVVMVEMRELIQLIEAIEPPDPATNDALAGLQGGLENATCYLIKAVACCDRALMDTEQRTVFSARR
jgi:hypothetical protein